MKLLLKNNEIPVLSFTTVEDIEQYYSTFTFLLPSNPGLENARFEYATKKYEITLIESVQQNGQYLCTAIPRKTFKLLNSTLNSFVGRATVKDLLGNKLGIPTNLKYDSIPGDWVIPRRKMESIFDIISNYAVVGNGGGVCFYLDFDGNMQMVDLKREFDLQSEQSFPITPIEDTTDISWILRVPGVVNLTIASIEEVRTEKLTIKEGYGEGSMFINNTVDNTTDLYKHRLINRFWRNYFSSRRLTTSAEIPFPTIGKIYNLGINQKFMLSRLEKTYTLVDNMVSTTAQFISNP